jgi:hypothetical protein
MLTAFLASAAVALAATTPAQPARPQSNGSYISTYIAVAYQDNFCLTYEGGGDPKDGDFVYMAPCQTKPTQVWLIYRNKDNVAFATPLAEPTPLVLAQRGRSSATILIDANKGTNYVLQLRYRGGDGHLYLFSNALFGGRDLGAPKHMSAGHTAQTYWAPNARRYNILLKLSNKHWKAD